VLPASGCTYRDPRGTPLAATAIRQPYKDGARRLYLSKDGRAAFVVSGTSVELWPHVTNDEYQRIDCN